MDKNRAISLLRQALDEIPSLKKKPYNNRDYPLWRSKINVVLEDTFGENSKEYKIFTNAGTRSDKALISLPILDDIANRQIYIMNLNSLETCLKSIIQKYELLLLNETPPLTESPIQLFDAMQFHSKVIEASRSLFESKHYAQAIFEAFKAVNNLVKEKSGKSQDGKDLMAKVFNESAPVIKLNDLETQSNKDEQEGFKFLFMGAMVGIRNPKAHDLVVQNDPYLTLEYLAFASLLLKRISFWIAKE
ncbi:MAG: TIGR02391 family protein [Dehalococcoidales bacterium]|nr:TIGR02391 family protein [Dehalococcoidales bacterium]